MLQAINVNEMEKDSRKNYRKYSLLAFLAAFLPRVLIACNMIPLRTLSDELCTVGSAAFLAGCDWSEIISHGGYYGFGYYFIFFPLFWLTDNPFLIYRIILIFNCLLQALIAPISFYIQDKFFGIKSMPDKAFISTICSYLVVTRATIMYNEHMLILIAWIILLLLCLLMNDFENHDMSKRRFHSCLLGIVISYSLTVHTRAIVNIFAAVLIIIMIRLIAGKYIVSNFFWGVMGSACIIANYVIKIVKNRLWLSVASRNAEISINLDYNWHNENTWKAVFSIWLGQISTATIFSCGIVAITLITGSIYFVRFLKNTNKANLYIIVVMSFSLICMGSATLYQSIGSWMHGVAEGFSQNITNNYYSYKALTYVRYMGPYISPLSLCGICLLYLDIWQLRRIRKFLLVFWAIVLLYVAKIVLPFLPKNSNANEVFIPLSFSHWTEKPNVYVYFCGFAVAFVFIFIYLVCNSLKRFKLALGAVLIVLLHQYGYNAFCYDKEVSEYQYRKVEHMYAFFEDIEDILQSEGIDELYVIEISKNNDHQIYYNCQFYFNRYTVHIELPLADLEEGIVFCNTEIPDLESKANIKCYKLDDDEFAYVIGEELNKQIAYANN